MRFKLHPKQLFYLIFICTITKVSGQSGGEQKPRQLRTTIHVFQDSAGGQNFSEDSINHKDFLKSVIKTVNYHLANLDSLDPPYSSPYIKNTEVQLSLDTIYFTRDNIAWNSDSILQSEYMDSVYVWNNQDLNYIQRHKTLHIFIAGNYHVVGGHVARIGDKRFIATRGFYHVFKNRSKQIAISLCWRNIIHELGHALGLKHNFQGGASGDQCDDCEDNGCPEEGTSNNIMDYWPGFGFALSSCQLEIINTYLSGMEGDISHVVINDSCYRDDSKADTIHTGTSEIWEGLKYKHGNVLIRQGASLIISGTVSMAENCSFIIEQNAELIVNGGVITNLCGDLWEGIILKEGSTGQDESTNNQAILRLINGAVLENSKIAVLSGSLKGLNDNTSYTGGGIIEAEGCLFKNNIIGVKFLPDNNLNNSYFKDCIFEITRHVNHYEEGFFAQVGVSIFGTNGIRFSGNRFINTIKEDEILFSKRGTGIYGMDASFKVGIDNIFQGLYYGIKYLSSNKIYRPLIQNSVFINNHRSIYLSGASFSLVAENSFELRRSEDTNVYGMCFENCSDFIIENNSIFSVFGGGKIAGLIIKESDNNNELIYSNSINNLPLAVLIQNSENIPSLRNNLFENNNVDILSDIKTGKGIGFINNSDFPELTESFPDIVVGGYKLFYKTDHQPVYYEYGDYEEDITFQNPEDNLFFSDPFQTEIVFPKPELNSWEYSVISDTFADLFTERDSFEMEITRIKASKDFQLADRFAEDIFSNNESLVLILQKLIANPYLLGIQNIKNNLEERFGILPSYMISFLKSILKKNSDFENTQNHIKNLELLQKQYLIRAIIYCLSDSIDSDSYDLVKYFQLEQNINSDLNTAFWYLSGSLYEKIPEFINFLENKYSSDHKYFLIIKEYIKYFQFIYNIRKENRTYFEMNQDEADLLVELVKSNNRIIAGLSTNILNYISNIEADNRILLPENIFLLKEPESGTLKNNKLLNIYPNPVKDYFMIEFDIENQHLSGYVLDVTNAAGQRIKSISLDNSKNLIVETDNFQSGLYFCNLISNGQLISVQKLIVLK